MVRGISFGSTLGNALSLPLSFRLFCLSGGLGGGLQIEEIFLLTNLVGFTLLTNLDPKAFLHLVCNFGIDLPRIVLFGTGISPYVLDRLGVPLGNKISCSACNGVGMSLIKVISYTSLDSLCSMGISNFTSLDNSFISTAFISGVSNFISSLCTLSSALYIFGKELSQISSSIHSSCS